MIARRKKSWLSFLFLIRKTGINFLVKSVWTRMQTRPVSGRGSKDEKKALTPKEILFKGKEKTRTVGDAREIWTFGPPISAFRGFMFKPLLTEETGVPSPFVLKGCRVAPHCGLNRWKGFNSKYPYSTSVPYFTGFSLNSAYYVEISSTYYAETCYSHSTDALCSSAMILYKQIWDD